MRRKTLLFITARCICICICHIISKSVQGYLCLSCLNFTRFSVHVADGMARSFLGGVTLPNSGFVDAVMFICSGPNGGRSLPQQPHCNVMHGLTLLLRGIGCVLSQTTVRAPWLVESFVQRVPGAKYVISCFFGVAWGLGPIEIVFSNSLYPTVAASIPSRCIEKIRRVRVT